MATTVRVTETFDLKTTVNKMGIIGIHTPTGEQIRRLYPGLVKNHRFVRVLKCDVVGACASVLPADPLQVGVSAGAVAPEDMFNPILYKAVTNESFDTLVSAIYGADDVSTLGSVNKNESLSGEGAFRVYYSMLAAKGWRKSMPQTGFKISNLVPLAHTLVSTYGNVKAPGNNMVLSEDGETPVPVPDLTEVPGYLDMTSPDTTVPDAITFKGKAVKMPKFPCHLYGPESWDAIPNLNIMKTFVACILVPPARLNEFYYRMRVSWLLRFEEVIPSTELATGGAAYSIGGYSYARGYEYSASKAELPSESSALDSDGVEVEKIMES